MTNIQVKELDKENRVRIYHQSNTTVLFHITGIAGEWVYIEIYGVMGKPVRALLHDTIFADNVQCVWEHILCGVYWCKVSKNKSVSIYPLFVHR